MVTVLGPFPSYSAAPNAQTTNFSFKGNLVIFRFSKTACVLMLPSDDKKKTLHGESGAQLVNFNLVGVNFE